MEGDREVFGAANLGSQGMNVDAEFFKGQLRKRGLSQRSVAKHLGISPAAVTLILQGKRLLRTSEAAAFATLLGVPLSEVIEHTGVRTSRESHCTVVYVVNDKGDLAPHKKRPSIYMPEDCDDSTLAARCEDPMSPRFGWVYFFAPKKSVDITARNWMYVVETRDGRNVIAFCAPGFDGKTFILQRESGANETADVVSASPITWIKLPGQ